MINIIIYSCVPGAESIAYDEFNLCTHDKSKNDNICKLVYPETASEDDVQLHPSTITTEVYKTIHRCYRDHSDVYILTNSEYIMYTASLALHRQEGINIEIHQITSDRQDIISKVGKNGRIENIVPGVFDTISTLLNKLLDID